MITKMPVKLLQSFEALRNMWDELNFHLLLFERCALFVQSDPRPASLEGHVEDGPAALRELIISVAHYFLASVPSAMANADLPAAVTAPQAVGSPHLPLPAAWPRGHGQAPASCRAKWTFRYQTSDHMKVPAFVLCSDLGVRAKLVKTFIKTHQNSDLCRESGPENGTKPGPDFG